MIVWPDTDSAVQTMPAIAITKNMPDCPLTPNRSSTTDEMMTVSIVMPDTGLRAMVAMAFAATEVKKNEKTQRQRQRQQDVQRRSSSSVPKNTATTSVADDDADELRHDREVAVGALAASSRRGGTRAAAIANEPTTTRSDLMMPKMPAVAIAPTPMKRT